MLWPNDSNSLVSFREGHYSSVFMAFSRPHSSVVDVVSICSSFLFLSLLGSFIGAEGATVFFAVPLLSVLLPSCFPLLPDALHALLPNL